MTRLTRTKSGNWATEITITRGWKWRFVGNFGTLEDAKAAAEIQRGKGRKVLVKESVTSKSQEKKHRGRPNHYVNSEYVGPKIGKVFWRVEAYIAKRQVVLTHATAAECVASGKQPGPCNL